MGHLSNSDLRLLPNSKLSQLKSFLLAFFYFRNAHSFYEILQKFPLGFALLFRTELAHLDVKNIVYVLIKIDAVFYESHDRFQKQPEVTSNSNINVILWLRANF